jgi:hypothetical protein
MSSPVVPALAPDLSASIDFSDDFSGPSHPDADRESMLDQLAALGFTNRVFASTLLHVNRMDMELTLANLRQFYGRT